ncbi:hypothetical protein [[Pseudomonas] boreopolis]|uniref:Uncharacterized protein n=1 Tax=Xanthomonas boreopolis TaxID=86183 RepID=A0A919KHT3_9XANT|nr:hypothetical protein GCM10009090_16240 [[Pseudomonas] boreopolis]
MARLSTRNLRHRRGIAHDAAQLRIGLEHLTRAAAVRRIVRMNHAFQRALSRHLVRRAAA